RPAHAPRLGLLGRARHGHRDRARATAAREARGGCVATAAARDGLGRRLQVVRMSVRSQLAALTLVAVCLPLVAVLGSGLVMFGRHDFEKILFVSGASGAVALACALLL